ncbi:glycosyltransferase family 20-domain-containing protein [Chaetomidium leptoderma]|uniref:Glycosyltransferase family 20-domain-containing protein n=1 Tax=Chaetomidium leptoderma TaxID=669021 RepID=A0AAN6ZYF0_9PEZI|nr:glycosyltransferase family 20-domain-containing protein [Chaetomidium leptoderma]
MTVFIASLFLPKTIHFTLPGTPPRGSASKKKQPGKKPELERQPSLFQPTNITPPITPTDDKKRDDPFLNEDGLRVHIPLGEPVVTDGLRAPADRNSPTWGGRLDQPMSRANSPPPPSLVTQGRLLQQKAKELGRQGVSQPRSLIRSDSHDRVFAHANWNVVNADQGNGGLRNAAEAAAREGNLGDYIWVGTLGMPTDALQGTQQLQDIEDRLATEHDMLTVFCSDKDFDGHYSHYCKQILWPVFHYQIPDNPKSKAYEDHSWQYYVKVNQAFADKIVKNWKRGDTIWVHDYHLLLVPAMVRKKIPDAKIGFFLHVAFPSSEVFRCLPLRKALLEGMVGANLIGFHIHEYTRHFLQTCSRLLSAEATTDGLQLEDRFVDVINLPIGIDPISLNQHREEAEVKKWLDIMRGRYAGKKLIVARDKLDHVRGVRQKLLSYELFLNKNPEWRDNIVLIQVALSTSEKSELDAAVSDIVTRVNSSWANLAYQPVVYLKQDIDYAQYLALLSIADALMITSQREGMNLTSHEYLYCQDGKFGEKKHGSLILSEFTGTSSLFGGNELSVNPWDYRACSEAIKKALEMGDEEKEERWNKLFDAVNRHTGSHWFTELMSRLDRVYEEQHRRDQTSVPRLSIQNLLQQYNRSERRLFILDFEGTLVNWGPVNQIIPVSPQRTLDVLNDLLLDERNTIYVMSGRRPEELDRLFRRVPNLGLIAENGCFIKDCGSETWAEMADAEQIRAWKDSVSGILNYYLERTPGAEIESRRCSLIFHYKSAEDYDAALRQATDCASHINDACEEQRVHAIPMDGCVLVEPIDWTKTTAAQKIFADLRAGMAGTAADERHKSPADFLMVVGDGREDEKVFKWANSLADDGTVKEVVTVSLGTRNTEATATMTQGVSAIPKSRNNPTTTMASFPPPPVNTIDWSNVGFRVREVNGHIESHYSVKTGKWSPLQFVADPYMRIHGMAPALNYGQQAYEGLKAFRLPGDAAIALFRPDRNAARLQHSADFISIPHVPTDVFLDAVRAAVALNAEYVPPHATGAAMYVRPQIYGSSAQLGLSPPDEYTFAVFVLPTGVYHGTHPVRALILEDFDRAAPNGTGSAKVGGNYAPVLRWSERARNEGYGITLHLDSKRHEEVDEFSTSGFIGALVDGEQRVTLVVPDSTAVIDSVTSDSVQQLGRSFGWKVEKRSIKYSELPNFTEVMAAGTAAGLVPIRSITRRSSALLPQGPRVSAKNGEETVTYIPEGDEEPGALCMRLLSQLKGIQVGKEKDDFSWRFEVTEEDAKRVVGETATGNGNGQTVDQLD